MTSDLEKHGSEVNDYYGLENLTQRILEKLKEFGFDIDNLTREALSTFEEFHIRGSEATSEMIELAGLKPGMRVLDIGCGIGGPGRRLAAECDVQIVGIDITEEFIDAARELTARVGLADKCEFVCGSALATPFEDESFDVVWMQHVNMNIKDKRGLFAELFRVLKPGGKLALYEIFARDSKQKYFPVPWADRAEISFLEDPDVVRAWLGELGFSEQSWRDATQPAIKWVESLINSPPPEKPRLTLGLISGSNFPDKMVNLLKTIHANGVVVAQAIYRK